MLLTLLQSGGAGPGSITGNLAATEAGADTLSAEGLIKVRGGLAASEVGADAFTAGGITLAEIVGTLAASEATADFVAAEGVVKVQGEVGATEGASDSFSASGDTVFFTITGTQALRLMHMHLLHGLADGSPLAVSPASRAAGGLVQSISQAGEAVTLITTAAPSVMVGAPGALIDELAALHGLSVPLTVSAAGRSAGGIVQTITTAADITTVARA